MIMADFPRITFRMVEGPEDREPRKISGEVDARTGEAGYGAVIRVTGQRSELVLSDFTAEQLDTLRQLAASLAETLRKHTLQDQPKAMPVPQAPTAAAAPEVSAIAPQAFKIGDAVRVRGGDGTEMVVDGFDATGNVICSFWQGVRRVQAAFRAATLEKSAPPPLPSFSDPPT
jgi:uncharacterized protein YodC (DUF2158 family)